MAEEPQALQCVKDALRLRVGGFARVVGARVPDPEADATGQRLLPPPGVGGGNLPLKESD